MKDNIDIEEIDKLAKLSKLRFTDDEKSLLVNEVSGIISMLKGCDGLNIDDVEISKSSKISDLRKDEFENEIEDFNIFESASNCKNGYFVVHRTEE